MIASLSTLALTSRAMRWVQRCWRARRLGAGLYNVIFNNQDHKEVGRAAERPRANALANSAARAVTGRRSRSMSDTLGCETPRCAANSACDRFALHLSPYSSSPLIGFSTASRYAATSRAFLAMGDARAAAATSRAADATSARVTGAGAPDVVNVEVLWTVDR
jgi:hypothetical protein